jgi:hypothetical protein
MYRTSSPWKKSVLDFFNTGMRRMSAYPPRQIKHLRARSESRTSLFGLAGCRKILFQQPAKPGNLALTAGFLLALVSCGGSPGGQVAGIEGTGDTVSAGTVSGFGSIYVNGVRYDTSKAAVTINKDRFATEDALKLGMVVRVEGKIRDEAESGVAERVVYDRVLLGPVTDVTQPGARKVLTVLGQTVVVAEDIAFSGTDFATLGLGQVVEVSGLGDDSGRIVATRVEAVATASSVWDVEGQLQSLDTNQQTFALQNLTVDYSAAEIDGDQDQLKADQLVEVEGSDFTDTGVFLATVVRIKDTGHTVKPGMRVRVEGIIESFTSLSSFQVGGLTVVADNAKIAKGDASWLGTGIRVSISGKTDDAGRLEADKVVLMLPSELKVIGPVESIDANAETVTVLGMTFTSDRLTAFEDDSDAADRFIDVQQLAIGDVVEVFGRQLNGENIATRIKRLNDLDGTVELEGRVTELEGTTAFYLLGMRITVDGAEGAELLATLQVGDFVEVEGTLTGKNTVAAARIDVEESDCEEPAQCNSDDDNKLSRP